MAYGLVESLTALIKSTADEITKEALSNLTKELEDKEKDAYESDYDGVRHTCLRKYRITLTFITQMKELCKPRS